MADRGDQDGLTGYFQPRRQNGQVIMLFGPFVYRFLLGFPLDDETAGRLAGMAIEGLRPPGPPSSSRDPQDAQDRGPQGLAQFPVAQVD